MAKYRKKPVVIEAVKWNGSISDGTQWPDWFQNGIVTVKFVPKNDGKLIIVTLEGDYTADIGDWVIRGVKNELYACKPDIFALTYELVPE